MRVIAAVNKDKSNRSEAQETLPFLAAVEIKQDDCSLQGLSVQSARVCSVPHAVPRGARKERCLKLPGRYKVGCNVISGYVAPLSRVMEAFPGMKAGAVKTISPCSRPLASKRAATRFSTSKFPGDPGRRLATPPNNASHSATKLKSAADTVGNSGRIAATNAISKDLWKNTI